MKKIRKFLRQMLLITMMTVVSLPACLGLPVAPIVQAAEVQTIDYDDSLYTYLYDDFFQEENTTPVVKLNNKALWMLAKNTRKLKLTGTKSKVKWSSSNKKVAKVSAKGVVTAKAAGTATITAKDTKTSKTYKCKVRVFTQASVKKKLLKLKKKYPEGMKWTNESAQYFFEATNTHGFGCYALVSLFSDKVFGKAAPVKRHKSFKKIKAGDHVRIGEYHSFIVLEKKGNKLTIVEGNYNGRVHWKRVVTKKELQAEGFWVETRYW